MNFNRIAPCFERLEKLVFRNQMQLCRTVFLTELSHLEKVAMIGEGDGRFLLEFLKQTNCPQVHYIDSSQVMLDLAQARINKQFPEARPRVRFYKCDLSKENMPEDNYNLVVTNFFLDVFNEPTLSQSITRIADSCCNDAIWLYADFQVAGSRFKQLRATLWLKTMYLFFKVVSNIQATALTDPAPLLEAHGFRVIHQREFAHGLMRAEFRQRV